ncbi:MAG: heme exporter protein CcmB [Desulfovibrionales bacterium]
MVARTLTIAGKDLRLVVSGGSGLVQAVLLGLLLIFLFSLAAPVGVKIEPQSAAAVFWLSSAFSLVLIFNSLYGIEEADDTRLALIIAPIPVQSVLLGKIVAGFCLLLLSQIVFVPAVIVFLGQDLAGSGFMGLGMILLADVGLTVLGGLLGALAQGENSRDALLSIILFPLLIPVLLAGIRVGGEVLSGVHTRGASSWLMLTLAFDAIFSGAALVLFPFVYRGD